MAVVLAVVLVVVQAVVRQRRGFARLDQRLRWVA